MTRPLLAVLAAVAALALAACGSKEEDVGATPARQSLDLVLDYFPNADHAPIYAAEASGAFAKAGLDVRIRTPSDPAAPLKLVEAGRADIAISYEPELLLARDKGADLVAIGALVPKPLTTLMALGSAKIHSPGDLDGKTVGTAGIPYQSAYLKTILDHAGVDPGRVKEVNVGFNLVPAMLSKKVDATLGAFSNYEGVDLQRRHKNPTIIPMQAAGVPTYDELIFVARKDTLQHRGELLRRFLQAVSGGAKAVVADPAAGVDPLVKANKDLDRGLQTASVKATPFLATGKGHPFGYMDPEEWRRYGDWMFRNRLLSTAPTEAALTNEFLPGEGLATDDTATG